MKLVIGNKNYSSWSMRPWVLMRQLEIPFEEEWLHFADPEFKARVLRYSPAGMVPVLIDGDVTIWDSLAIIEYLAEKLPDRGVWPRDVAARARARSISAEMHAGFGAMRRTLSMNTELRVTVGALDNGVRRDLARIFAMWSDCRAQFGAGGPFLFGAFSAADAYYAPVVRRFVSYGVDLPEVPRHYVETMEALPVMQAWTADALAEHEFVSWDEPYRDGRG
jgi:glutathione S-transferase